MEKTISTLILILIYAIILFTLFLIFSSNTSKRWRHRFQLFKKAKNKIEQRLVLEAIAASSIKSDLSSIVHSIGMHAANMTGFTDWIIWLMTDNDGLFRIFDASDSISDQLLSEMQNNDYERLSRYVRNNVSPLPLDGSIVSMTSDSNMKSLFQSFVSNGGLLVPFYDGKKLLGFIILGGRRDITENRSEQFLSLYGACAAIIINKAILDKQERELRNQQQRAENLASMGKMAAGLAHEIRNPLTFVRATTEHLAQNLKINPEDKSLLFDVVDEIDRINLRIEELLSLSRIDPDNFKPLVLTDIISKSVATMHIEAKLKKVKICTNLLPDRILVNGDPDKLRQLIQNILLNAIQAMNSGGSVCITHTISENQFTTLEFHDNGTGIDSEIQKRIFDPFFSTKEKGTGLGLAICYSIVRSHGGSLELVKSDSYGTVFRVSLPIAR